MEPISEELVTLTQALVESDSLRAWFAEVRELPRETRAAALDHMARSMREDGEDPALVSAVELLARDEVFQAVEQAVKELGG